MLGFEDELGEEDLIFAFIDLGIVIYKTICRTNIGVIVYQKSAHSDVNMRKALWT